MASINHSVTVGDLQVYDTTLIYFRLTALQLSRETTCSLKDLLRYEFATAIFADSGLMLQQGTS